MSDGEDGRDRHGYGCSTGSTANAPTKDEDEEGIEDNVEHGSSSHNPHGFGGIARSSNQSAEVEGYGSEEHAWQDDDHVVTGVGDGGI